MSFLQSVITDARPRGPLSELSDSLLARPGLASPGVYGDAAGAEGDSPDASAQTSLLRTPLPVREGESQLNVGGASSFQGDDPVNQGIPDTESNADLESRCAGAVDESREVGGEERNAPVGSGTISGRAPDSEGGKGSGREGHMIPQSAGTVLPDAVTTLPMEQGHGPFIASPETHSTQNQASGYVETEPVGFQASIGDTLGKELTSKYKSYVTVHPGVHEGEKNAPKVPLASSGHSPDPSGTLTPDAAVAAVSPAVGGEEDLHHSDASRVDEAIGPITGQAPMSDNAAGRNETEEALPDRSKASHISPVIEQHIAKPESTPARPGALLSVPARPFQTDSIPKVGGPFHSRPTLRVPEKRDVGPNVQIGQIDVIIEAPTQAAARPSTPPSSIELASRHYLRRL